MKVKKGRMLGIEPEKEAVEFSFFDCWSESGDETTPQFDWEDTRSISIFFQLIEGMSIRLNMPEIHPTQICGKETFEHWYLTQGQHAEGYPNAFIFVSQKLLSASFDVYISDTRFEVYAK